MINELISENLIQVNLNATTKNEVFDEMASMLEQQGKITNKQQFLDDIKKREHIDNTGFSNGVAIPHVRSNVVKDVAIVVGISHSGIEYGAEGNQLSKIFFMIASPETAIDRHIEILTKLFAKLLEPGITDSLLNASTAAELLAILQKENSQTTKNKGLIIGVTGCPSGVAHTYLSAEAITQAAEAMGYEAKVETNGSVGVKNSPTQAEIERAIAVIVCSDQDVDISRFDGKKLLRTSIKAPITDGKAVIQKALSMKPFNSKKPEENTESSLSSLYRYLLSSFKA